MFGKVGVNFPLTQIFVLIQMKLAMKFPSMYHNGRSHQITMKSTIGAFSGGGEEATEYISALQKWGKLFDSFLCSRNDYLLFDAWSIPYTRTTNIMKTI